MTRTLLTPDGAYDKRAILKDAHRRCRLMRQHEWSFSRCLSFSWQRAKAMRTRAAEQPELVRRLLAQPDAEGVAGMFMALTGKAVTPEELARIADKLVEAEAHRQAAQSGP